jgi:soluble lytic murein transglycosylase-like protein
MKAHFNLLILLALGGPLWSAELALLKSGFAIRCQSHTIEGDVAFLKTGDGIVTIQVSEIEGFETEIRPPAPTPIVEPQVAVVAVQKPVLSPKQLIEDKAKVYGIPASFVHSVVQAESAYQVNALSPKGAIGLMQLMPQTAKSLGADPRDPEQNVEAGVRHLTDLLVRYKNDPEQVRKALAAYNAGVGAVDRYNGVPPYPETQMYVEKILRQYNALRK